MGQEEFWLDLLFYHVKLRAFVVVDLKTQPFRAEFAGKMNFYLSAVNDLLRHPDDQPSIGLILCKTRDRVVAEYSLRDVSKPIGVSEYQLAAALPEKLKGTLPTIGSIPSTGFVVRVKEAQMEGSHEKYIEMPMDQLAFRANLRSRCSQFSLCSRSGDRSNGLTLTDAIPTWSGITRIAAMRPSES